MFVCRNVLYATIWVRTIHGQSQHQIKIANYIKDPVAAKFTAQAGCGKMHLILELTEKEYNKNFDFIVFICPTLPENYIYHAKE